jgi:hypothetical protein
VLPGKQKRKDVDGSEVDRASFNPIHSVMMYRGQNDASFYLGKRK